ncbi:hypothetical protein Isop_1983 [Isosphaera pallida ATCC 43644]|uniref:Uncharacterized protein n=1 Tax=Isosphaera pallida (strain ATCC 43644 / DSM 9630 / IS1B) TaxID=575540 RepID=E8R344_ISOPI|nr:hypothetical protein Isop_1983 [Isosphaera pallida ATCC 43644]
MPNSNSDQMFSPLPPMVAGASNRNHPWNDARRFHLARKTLQRSRHRIARERRGLLKAVPVPALIALIEAILPLIAQIFELIERVFQSAGDRIARDPDASAPTTWPVAADLAATPVSDLDSDLVRALGEVLANPSEGGTR